ncbi:MAG: hypothetical protein U0Z53_15130 [Blastocatellia bacterium]
MARGWESKAVEDQMEEARRAQTGRPTALSPEEIALRQRRETLRLTRSQLNEQMSRARSDAHRQRLAESLAEIDRQLAELNQTLNADG